MNLNLKLPTNIISNNVLQNLLYFITLALAVSYVINDHTWAFITLILIASGIYVMTKNIVFALFTSIIITNLLLAVNFFKFNDIIEKQLTKNGVLYLSINKFLASSIDHIPKLNDDYDLAIEEFIQANINASILSYTYAADDRGQKFNFTHPLTRFYLKK